MLYQESGIWAEFGGKRRRLWTNSHDGKAGHVVGCPKKWGWWFGIHLLKTWWLLRSETAQAKLLKHDSPGDLLRDKWDLHDWKGNFNFISFSALCIFWKLEKYLKRAFQNLMLENSKISNKQWSNKYPHPLLVFQIGDSSFSD